jgi:hypothetical protein
MRSSQTHDANGEPWELLNGGAITYYAARAIFGSRLTQRQFAVKILLENADQDGIVNPTALHQRAIALWRSRDEDCACLR